MLIKQISSHIIYVNIVTDMLTKSEERYAKANGVKLFLFQKDIGFIRQGTSDVATLLR